MTTKSLTWFDGNFPFLSDHTRIAGHIDQMGGGSAQGREIGGQMEKLADAFGMAELQPRLAKKVGEM